MKKIVLLYLLSLFSAFTAFSQTSAIQPEGVVSYITSQNVYVKFSSTENISVGDTLYRLIDGKNVPALRVKNLSSISCVCEPLNTSRFTNGDRILTGNKSLPAKKEVKKDTNEINTKKEETLDVPAKDTLLSAISSAPARKQIISGRVSAASYFGLSDTPSGNSLRMRYNLSLNVKNIGNSRLSAESYISFSHRNKQWDLIKEDIFNGLKIYNLSLNYEIGRNARIYAGRKINPKISNMGAVDGLQFEIKTGSITSGVLAGSRPDFSNYGFNTSLFQYGAFINHERGSIRGNIQTTLAFIEQRNSGITDRRFAYIQHSNTLVKKLSIFGSAEFDLYRYDLKTDTSQLVADTFKVISSAPKLSNLYLSLRYRFSDRFSLSLSYSSRQNIIYYETYKNFIDQLLERETQQGYQMQISYRPYKKLMIGANGGYRKRKNDPAASENLYAYITYSQIPFVGISATLSATALNTSYLKGGLFGLNLARDIVKGKLNGAFTYRFLDYFYTNSNSNLMQHTGEISLNWKIKKKLSCSFYYEGSFDSRYIYNRFFVQLSKRL